MLLLGDGPGGPGGEQQQVPGPWRTARDGRFQSRGTRVGGAAPPRDSPVPPARRRGVWEKDPHRLRTEPADPIVGPTRSGRLPGATLPPRTCSPMSTFLHVSRPDGLLAWSGPWQTPLLPRGPPASGPSVGSMLVTRTSHPQTDRQTEPSITGRPATPAPTKTALGDVQRVGDCFRWSGKSQGVLSFGAPGFWGASMGVGWGHPTPSSR